MCQMVGNQIQMVVIPPKLSFSAQTRHTKTV